MHPWERAAAAIRSRPDLAQRSVPLPPDPSAERDIRDELEDLRRRVAELEAEVEATTAGRIERMNDDALEDAAASSKWDSAPGGRDNRDFCHAVRYAPTTADDAEKDADPITAIRDGLCRFTFALYAHLNEFRREEMVVWLGNGAFDGLRHAVPSKYLEPSMLLRRDSIILDGVEFWRIHRASEYSFGRPSDVNDARWATTKLPELRKRTIGEMLTAADQKGRSSFGRRSDLDTHWWDRPASTEDRPEPVPLKALPPRT